MRRLSQVFLTDKNLLRKIVESSEIRENETVIEVGPGKGHLTERILERGARVVGIEIDRNLIRELRKKFTLLLDDRFYLIEGDYLKLNIKKLLEDLKIEFPLKFLSNIPYSITSQILLKLVEERKLYREIYMTLQREVAERLKALPNTDSYGSLSIYMQYHFEIEIMFYIKRGSFRPVPKVDSAFTRLKPRKYPPVTLKDEKLFFSIVRIAFSERRKKLRTLLKRRFDNSFIDEIEKISGISLDLRGETLSIKDFAKLANIIYDIGKRE
jgi:16S rRNA (adenine1518-N6/adenine1519-N6)-dimethyltransferase